MDIEPSLSQVQRFPQMGKGNRANALGGRRRAAILGLERQDDAVQSRCAA